MANKVYTTMSEESIRYLCGLINQIVSLPTDIISNINLADNLTFSNIHIKNLIDKCLEDANAEAEKLVGALTHLTCKETTVQPTLDNSEINVIYLYSADGNAPYQQYLKISDTKLVDLGSTSVSLTDYLTITSAASTYAKQTDLKTLSDEVSGIKTKIGSGSLDTTSDTLVGAINEVKTSVPTDDDIKSLADGQINSKKQILGFNDLKGITADSTLDDVVKAVPNGKIAILQSANFTNYLGLPHQMYTITITSLGYNRNQIIATAKYSDNPSISFIGGCNNSSGTDIYDQWIKMPTTNDITTTISSASTDTQIPSAKAVFDKINDSVLGVEITGSNYSQFDSSVLNWDCGVYVIGMTSTAQLINDLPQLVGGTLYITSISKTYETESLKYRQYRYITFGGNEFIRSMEYQSGSATYDTGWEKVCTTKVADVARKTITNPSNVTSGTISYAISNGICSVEIIGITPDGTGGVTIPLPKSLYYTVGVLVDPTGTPVGSACGGTNGAFNIIDISGTTALYGGFSYPVAES